MHFTLLSPLKIQSKNASSICHLIDLIQKQTSFCDSKLLSGNTHMGIRRNMQFHLPMPIGINKFILEGSNPKLLQ